MGNYFYSSSIFLRLLSIDSLPTSMQFISMIFPPSYIFEAMREILINEIVNYDLLKKIIILNFLYLSLSIIFFIKIINISREKRTTHKSRRVANLLYSELFLLPNFHKNIYT